MKYYFRNKDGTKTVIKKEERIEHLKNLSKKLRKQLSEDTEILFPDEIYYFITILKAELEHILTNGGERMKQHYSFYKLEDGTEMMSVWEQENHKIANVRVFRKISENTWQEK